VRGAVRRVEPLKQVRVGCSGWNYDHWRNGVFYPPRCPPRKWLEYYARHFDTVEVNATFYRLPRPEVVANWVTTTPPGFLLAIKISRYITHIKRLLDLGAGVETFYDRIDPLVRSPKMGPVLWQLPGNFRRDDERLGSALAHLPPGRHCVEFRHESWFVPEVYELLQRHGVALVIGDDPRRPFQTHELTTGWTLIRFHSGSRGLRGNYSESELEEWAQQIETWRREIEVFAYFNNDREGFAIKNGLWLKERLGV
jgi:uncharacterized protein YecE (DUF72 family)